MRPRWVWRARQRTFWMAKNGRAGQGGLLATSQGHQAGRAPPGLAREVNPWGEVHRQALQAWGSAFLRNSSRRGLLGLTLRPHPLP